jgi:short-subunit dehydrogenase
MATALITGASAGLGAEFARQLAARGDDLVLVARSQERLDALAAHLRREHAVQAEVIVADLAVPGDVDRIAHRLRSMTSPVDLLVNNAGLGQGRAFIRNDVESEVAAADVMVRAVLVLTHAALQAMVGRGSGAIVNVSSVATWLGNGTYSAHKAWVTSFTEGLAGQLRGTGVTATAVLPGLTRTEFHERAGITDLQSMPNAVWLSAAEVVRATLRASKRGKVLVTPSARYAVIAWLARTAPRTWVRATSRRTR